MAEGLDDKLGHVLKLQVVQIIAHNIQISLFILDQLIDGRRREVYA